jgi:hypothetical protein
MINNNFQFFMFLYHLANSSPLTRKNFTRTLFFHYILNKILFLIILLASDSTSPTPSTPMSAPGSPAPHPLIPGYNFNPSSPNGNPSICVSESIYCSKYLSCFANNLAKLNGAKSNRMIK